MDATGADTEAQVTCPRCNGSGTIACSIYFPCGYVAPGPVPEDARGVYEAKCDECGGIGYMPVTCPRCDQQMPDAECASGCCDPRCPMPEIAAQQWRDAARVRRILERRTGLASDLPVDTLRKGMILYWDRGERYMLEEVKVKSLGPSTFM